MAGGELVEIDPLGLDARPLQHWQHGINHWGRSAGIGVDVAVKRILAQLAGDHFVDEAALSRPIVAIGGMREGGNELEIGKGGGEAGKFVQEEQVGTGASAVEEAYWPRLAAGDVVA